MISFPELLNCWAKLEISSIDAVTSSAAAATSSAEAAVSSDIEVTSKILDLIHSYMSCTSV